MSSFLTALLAFHHFIFCLQAYHWHGLGHRNFRSVWKHSSSDGWRRPRKHRFWYSPRRHIRHNHYYKPHFKSSDSSSSSHSYPKHRVWTYRYWNHNHYYHRFGWRIPTWKRPTTWNWWWGVPTLKPSRRPTTKKPTTTRKPTSSPLTTLKPTLPPIFTTTKVITTITPTKTPSKTPTTKTPTKIPTKMATKIPTKIPTKTPTTTKSPTKTPEAITTAEPSKTPTTTASPTTTIRPSGIPTKEPVTTTRRPTTSTPTKGPTFKPTKTPTKQPTSSPTTTIHATTTTKQMSTIGTTSQERSCNFTGQFKFNYPLAEPKFETIMSICPGTDSFYYVGFERKTSTNSTFTFGVSRMRSMPPNNPREIRIGGKLIQLTSNNKLDVTVKCEQETGNVPFYSAIISSRPVKINRHSFNGSPWCYKPGASWKGIVYPFHHDRVNEQFRTYFNAQTGCWASGNETGKLEKFQYEWNSTLLVNQFSGGMIGREFAARLSELEVLLSWQNLISGQPAVGGRQISVKTSRARCS